MSNVLFLSSRWIDGATLTASSEQGLLGVEHLQTYRPDQVLRTTNSISENVAFDFGQELVVEAVGIAAHNLSEDAEIRLRLGTTAGAVTSAPGYDSGFVSAWPSSGKPTDPEWPSYFSLLVAENAVAYRYGRLDIQDASNPDSYIQIGRLFVGPAFVPEINVDINPSLGLAAPGEAVVSSFGRTFMDERGPSSRIWQVAFSAMDQNELLGEMFELERYHGIAKDFAFCLDPAATDHFHKFAGQYRFESLQAGQALPYFSSTSGRQVWQKTLTIAEIL